MNETMLPLKPGMNETMLPLKPGMNETMLPLKPGMNETMLPLKAGQSPDFKKTSLYAHAYRFMLISSILRLIIEIGIKGATKNSYLKFSK